MKKSSIVFMLLICFDLSGQFVEPKFGKVEMSDLEMKSYDKDTSATALILFNSGYAYFILNNELEFQFVYERHCQIKIFKKAGLDYADFKIRLNKQDDNKEVLSGLKAYTYNLVDGKMERTKLENNMVYETEEDKGISVSFALPNVKEGSVIEVEYSITSDFLYNFRGWNFQYAIPARWSQYTYKIPEYFKYRESTKGYFNFDVNKREMGSVTFMIPASTGSSSNGFVARAQVRTSEPLKAGCQTTILATRDMPAFLAEPNIDCEENYIQSLEFELASITLPGQMEKNYVQTWETVNKQMLDDEDFGQLLKSGGFVKDTVQLICSNKNSDLEKAKSLYEYVQSRMTWNETYSLWAMKGLKKPYEDRIGNSAEINLLLTLMLKTAGLSADPVLFSTRGNGIAVTYYPTITKYNSVLVGLKVNGKTYLMDATSKYCPFGILPANDINGQGRSISGISGEWIDLNASGRFRVEKYYVLNLSDEGKFTGHVKGTYSEYAGISYRNTLNSAKSVDDYIIKLQEDTKGLSVSNHLIAWKNHNDAPVKDSLCVEIADHAERIGNKLIFNPLIFERIEKNRYTLEDRKYPVNYNYPYSEKYSFEFILPEGYKVESMPQSRSLRLDDNSITLTYTVESTGNHIIVSYERTISKIVFLPADYRKLKDLYDQLVKIHSDQVVLTRIS